MEEKPSYFATLPANVRYDKRLKLLSRMLWAEISALSNKEGYCWATNKYFANLYDVSIQTISGCINQLKEYGYLDTKIIYVDDSKQIEKRIISLIPIQENLKGGIQENLKGGIQENLKGNNININNTSININEGVDKKTDPFMITDTETFFRNEYQKRFGNRPYILSKQKEKIRELKTCIDDFEHTIPQVLDDLKEIEFTFDDKPTIHPDYLWLLKDDNYVKILSGFYKDNIKKTKVHRDFLKSLKEMR